MVLAAGRDHYAPIALGRGVRADRRELRALAGPDEAVFYTSGRTQQRGGVPLPAARPAVRHQQPARLLEHVPRVERRRAAPRRSAIGKGTVSLDDFEHADLIFVVGQNPGTNHPRMLTDAARRPSGAARAIVAINPLREVGLMRFSNPQTVARRARRGHGARGPTSCRSGSAATWRCSRRLSRLLLEARGRALRARCSTATFIERAHRRLRRVAAHVRATPWDDVRRGAPG